MSEPWKCPDCEGTMKRTRMALFVECKKGVLRDVNEPCPCAAALVGGGEARDREGATAHGRD